MSEGILDRVLATVAPGVAVRRAAARFALERYNLASEQTRRITASYDAAQVGRRTDGWQRVGTSQNAEAGPALHRLRNAARERVRNDPYASRARRVVVANMVGCGIIPRPISENDAERASARDRWTEFVETCDPEGRLDYYGLQRLAGSTVFESGEALKLWEPVARKGRLTWQVRVLEPDYLDTTRTGTVGDNYVIQGVEFDRSGRRVAYWLFDQHPGDRFGVSFGAITSKRVRAEFVDHMFDVIRPGQVRGIPWLAPVLMTLRDLSDLAEAELVRRKLEACIALVVTTPEPPDEPVLGTALKDSNGNQVDRMAPGMTLFAGPGQEVNGFTPTASEGLVETMKDRLHAVAAGAGTTYHQLTGDLSSANYSSLRGGLVEFRQMLDCWQADIMIHQNARPAWRRVQGDGAPRARYIVPARPWVDPEKDVKAAVLAIENYIDSPQDVIAMRGQDPDEQLDEHKTWREALERRGLPLPTKSTSTTPAKNQGEDDDAQADR